MAKKRTGSSKESGSRTGSSRESNSSRTNGRRPHSPGLPADLLSKLKEKLEKQRETLRQEIGNETDQLKVFGTPDPREDADIAEETWEDEEVSRTVEVLQVRFGQIEEALDRLRSGAYGICADCKKPIPRERLEAFPSAIRCVSCQEKHEAKTARPPKNY